MRNRVERNYDKFDRVNGYAASVNKDNFSWKVPTYDLSWDNLIPNINETVPRIKEIR